MVNKKTRRCKLILLIENNLNVEFNLIDTSKN